MHKLLRKRIYQFYFILRRGRFLDDEKTKKLCKKLIKHRKSLWLFCYDKNIEPTNNHAERQIRHAVIWRKKCFGTQSDRGMLYVERILSVIKTCHQQRLNCFDFIKQSLFTNRMGVRHLSLICTT
jgi:transposase